MNAVLGIAVAIFLNEVRGKLATRFYQSIMLVPFLISWVVVSYLAYAFLATDTGFINNSILEPLGLQPISWYTEAKYWPAILIFVQVWKSIGFQCVIYYSSLISISTDYVYARSDNAPVVVELQVDQDAIYYSLPIVNRVAFVFSFACLLLVPFLYILFHRMILRPLGVLDRAFRAIESGQADYRVTQKLSSREFSHMAHSFNAMAQQITHLKIESYERELEKSKILMRNIQLQVRPHFMLNLFHLIYSMAQIQNYKGIQEMTLYLSKYFRKLFSKGDVHTLAEECELVSGYFKVLYTQYPDCFGFTQELDESVKEVKIPTGTAEDGAVIAEKTASYILGHLSDKLSVEDLAFRAHLNPDYLNRVFKKAKGISINKFIINQRMSLAMELMKGGLSATAAAQEVGYQNYANFVNMFKKVYGKLPSQLGEK